MFSKLLVANRGEISLRIQKTARRMGIRTVAIFEDPDRFSPYVRYADEAYELFSGYLDQDAIVRICLENAIQAIHPGYGFLSENYQFAEKCKASGIVFVGPDPEASRKMGEKTKAREEARLAGVPLLPGAEISADWKGSEIQAETIAEKIGYPLIIKAAAGGGGKGMVIVRQKAELWPAWEKVRREADRLYKNKGLVVERFLEKARHIEVQILGNCNAVNFVLSDRDCSLQRNNQKIIEEAPAVNIPDEARAQLHKVSKQLADRVGYKNAGTLEFLYNSTSHEFYFLEMNTRLQVEHTVTEMVTGLDLVEEQLKIAYGINTEYSACKIHGHSIQARICAENPADNYAPSAGKVLHYEEPVFPHVRIDSGIETGSIITTRYDNMLAKLIVHAKDRESARELLLSSLKSMKVAGIDTNIPQLIQILNSKVFPDVSYYTRYLQSEFIHQEKPNLPIAEITAALLYHLELMKGQKDFKELAGFRQVLSAND